MATEKTFTIVGYSCLNGVFKVRYANSVDRTKVLAKNGHTDIWLIQLDSEGRKEDCVSALLTAIETEGCPEAAKLAIHEEARKLGFQVE